MIYECITMDTIELQIEDINNQINQLTFKKLELEMQLDEF